MKTRCINLRDHEVRGLLDGSITALWRPVKERIANRVIHGSDGVWYDADCINPGVPIHCPWKAGDMLICREKWCEPANGGCEFAHPAYHWGDTLYAADEGKERRSFARNWYQFNSDFKWLSASQMPASLSRIRRELVAVECRHRWSMESPQNTDQCLSSARWAFANMFNKTHGRSRFDFEPWDTNTWCWLLTVKEVAA